MATLYTPIAPAAVTVCDERPEHGHERRSEYRSGEDEADLDRVEAEPREVDRDDDREIAVREGAENPSDEKLLAVGREPSERRRDLLLDHAPGSAASGNEGQTGARPGGHEHGDALGATGDDVDRPPV